MRRTASAPSPRADGPPYMKAVRHGSLMPAPTPLRPGTRAPLAFALALSSLLLVLAGCLHNGRGSGIPPVTAPPPAGPIADARAAAGCDGPVWGSRVRAREMDVVADPADRSRMAAGMMVSIPSSRPAAPDDPAIWLAFARSKDGGATWTGADLGGWPGDPTMPAPYLTSSLIAGDPALAFLPDGTLLYVGLAIRGGAAIDVFAARFPADSLAPSEVATISRGGWGDDRLNQVPGPYQVVYNDKPSVAVDAASGAIYVGWMWRTNAGPAGARSIPVVSMSTDGGRTWQGPAMLIDSLGAPLTADDFRPGAIPFITSDGKVHALWMAEQDGHLWQADATLGKLDFGPVRQILPAGDGFQSSGGVLGGLPDVAVGPGTGGQGERVMVVWGQPSSGQGFDSYASHSDDHGATWSTPAPVTPANLTGGDQMLPAVAVSPGGLVAVSFLDRHENPSSTDYRAAMALSRDGVTWEEVPMASVPTVPGNTQDPIQPIGDYYGVAFGSRGPVAMWEDGREGTTDKHYGTAYRCVVPLA